MFETIKLKVKKSEALHILTIILKFYMVFLFFLGIIINSNETIIEACLILVVVAVFDFINDEELIISDQGIKYKKMGFTKWSEIEFFNIRKYILEIKIKNQKIKRIEISMKEDPKNIENANKFVNSKIQTEDFDRSIYEKEIAKRKKF
jgi:hypothetical protein